MHKYLPLIIFVFAFLAGKAQDEKYTVDPKLINLKAKILSSADSSAIPYANIFLTRVHSGTITNGEGYFSFELLNTDSLEVTSLGFETTILKIPPSYAGYEVLTYYMRPILYNVGEVMVEGQAKKIDYFEHGEPIDIRTELRGDAFNEKPTVFKAVKSPLSYLQYKFSKREKSKREVRVAMVQDEKWETFSERYNKKIIIDITGLNEAYADTFIMWFNTQNRLTFAATAYQIRASVLESLPLFKQTYKVK